MLRGYSKRCTECSVHTEHRLLTTSAVQPGLDTVAVTAKQGRILPEYHIFLLYSIDLFLFFLPTYRNPDKCRPVAEDTELF